MSITPEESEAYNAALRWADCDAYNTVNKAVYLSLILALRRHVAGELKLEFWLDHEVYESNELTINKTAKPHCAMCGQKSNWDARHDYTDDDWDQAADVALKGKSDG